MREIFFAGKTKQECDMKRTLLVSLALVTSCAIAPYAISDDQEHCLACHEPAEDWEGMGLEEIIATSQDPENPRHEQNRGLSEEQLKAIIIPLLEE